MNFDTRLEVIYAVVSVAGLIIGVTVYRHLSTRQSHSHPVVGLAIILIVGAEWFLLLERSALKNNEFGVIAHFGLTALAVIGIFLALIVSMLGKLLTWTRPGQPEHEPDSNRVNQGEN